MVTISSLCVGLFYVLLFSGIFNDFQFKKKKIYNFSLIGSFVLFLVLQILAISIHYNNIIVGIPFIVFVFPAVLSITIPFIILVVVMMKCIAIQENDMIPQ
jgi:uncharacterized membrane protein